MERSPMLVLLERGGWGEYQPAFDRLSDWCFYPLLLSSLTDLKQEALFVSKMHGLGHIERTMLQGGFCAMEERLDLADTQLLLDCCAYHDVGRQNDWVDDEHGHRSAAKIGALTGRTGEDLKLIQAAVDAHSRWDKVLEETLRGYAPGDFDRALRLAKLLKDADGLDRVRLGDLNPSYLRCPSSRDRAGLAREVFSRYQLELGLSPEPFFTEDVIAKIRRQSETPPAREVPQG